MATTGQTINDRLNAVRYALVGQGLARTVCKATTEEVVGPKKKHIDYLLACTNEPNVSIPQLANLLIERTQHTSWAVVSKALSTIHHLMSHGNERFAQYLATSNHSFELSDFMDRKTPQGYTMSTFVRRYSKYVNYKITSYRTLAIDLCKIRTGNDNALRTMNMDNLSKTLPIVQNQFNCLLEFSAEAKDLNNGVIMSVFRLLYKDLVRLYVAYQEAIINLLERYFKLSRKKTREALEMYKQYLATMDKVADFLRIVDAVGLDKSDMPDLTNSPGSILRLLEQHLSQLEAKKRGTTPVSHEAEEPDEVNQPEDRKSEFEPVEHPREAENDNKENTVSKTAGLPEKRSPPQKPARPSPKASPTSSAKPKPPAPKTTTSSSPQPNESPVALEKKGPPERPAKPPSRPPPPPATNQATQATPTAPPAHPPPPKVANSPTPPHPPPPTEPKSKTADETQTTSEPEPTNNNGTSDETQESSVSVSQETTSTTNGQSIVPPDQPPVTTSCSTVSASQVTEEQPTEVETNHVNNSDGLEHGAYPEVDVIHDEQELVPPPPPPPPPLEIQDGDFDDQEHQEGGAQADTEEPTING